jgi:hypothetical protein
MDSMTIAIVAFFFSLASSVLSGYCYRKDQDSLLHFMLFAVMVFCFGVNSTILLFKLIIAGA